MRHSILVVTFLFFTLLLLSVGGIAKADEKYFKQGDWEVGFRGGYNMLDVEVDGDSENFDFLYLEGEVAYFLIDGFSFGANPFWFYLPEVSNVEGYAVGIEGNLRYHFQFFEHFIPYVGANFGYATAKFEYWGDEDSEDLTTWGFHGGFKVPINENIFFDTQLKWTDYNMPYDFVDLNTLQILFGLKIKF